MSNVSIIDGHDDAVVQGDLISRSALISAVTKQFCDGCNNYEGARCRSCEIDEIFCHIEEAPAVDAVAVVRCKDCRYYEIHKPRVLENCERKGYLIPMAPDDFCSYGERRDGE